MKYFVIALAAFFISSTAHAACTTFGTMTSCSDGNTYNKIGNTIYGSNSRTGSSWSQTTIGNSTYGTASDGSSWSTTRMGNSSCGTRMSSHVTQWSAMLLAMLLITLLAAMTWMCVSKVRVNLG